MTEVQYSNREIDFHFNEIKEILNRIEAQTIKTNGRVSKCEENISKLSQWKSFVAGGLAIITTILLPIIGFMWYDQTILDKQVSVLISQSK